jgi:His-Xaa-Ser system protein HxsD
MNRTNRIPRTLPTIPATRSNEPRLKAHEGNWSVASTAGESDSVRVEVRGPELTIRIDETVYSRDAVLRACHWFTDRCYLIVSHQDEGSFLVRIRAKADGLNLEAVAGDFENALLDAQLRVEIGRETGKIRELIVAKAFAEGELLDDPPVGDWRDSVAGKHGGGRENLRR